ncbi:DUF1398 family protein [Escherichia coli]
MFEQVRKEQNFSWFYSELKHHRIAHYIYYLATDNIRIITHDDTVLLLRGTRNLLKVSTTKNPAKIKEAALLHICGKSTFREYCSTLAGAGVFRWVTDVNHNKRSYYAIRMASLPGLRRISKSEVAAYSINAPSNILLIMREVL